MYLIQDETRPRCAQVICSWPKVLLGLLVFSDPLLADDDATLWSDIQAIESQSHTADWREADAQLESLKDRLAVAPKNLRVRAGLIRARHYALRGQEKNGLAQLESLRDKGPDPDLKLRSYGLSANLAMNLDRHGEAFRYLRGGLELLPEVDDARARSEILGHAAMVYFRLGEYEQAADYGERGVNAARASGSQRDLCLQLERLTVSHSEARPWVVRHASLTEAKAACLAVGETLFLASVIRHWGRLMQDDGRLQAAEMAFADAHVRMEILGYQRGVFSVSLDQAELWLEQGEPDRVVGSLGPVMEQLRERDELSEVHRGLGLMALAMEAQGDVAGALASLKEAEQVRDHLVERERGLRRDYLRTAFETELQQQELRVLREQARVVELEAQARAQRRHFAFLAYAAIALILLLLFLQLIRSGRDRRYFRRLAERDSLTGLFNHSHFFKEADAALEAARAQGQSFVMLLADIDHFKWFNDNHGHAAGDGALRKVAALFEQVFGDTAIIGRIGGEEFGLALPGWTREQACQGVTLFCQALEPLVYEGRRLNITLSFGLAVAPGELGLERLRRLTDDALYQAKREGRNRLVTAELSANSAG